MQLDLSLDNYENESRDSNVGTSASVKKYFLNEGLFNTKKTNHVCISNQSKYDLIIVLEIDKLATHLANGNMINKKTDVSPVVHTVKAGRTMNLDIKTKISYFTALRKHPRGYYVIRYKKYLKRSSKWTATTASVEESSVDPVEESFLEHLTSGESHEVLNPSHYVNNSTNFHFGSEAVKEAIPPKPPKPVHLEQPVMPVVVEEPLKEVVSNKNKSSKKWSKQSSKKSNKGSAKSNKSSPQSIAEAETILTGGALINYVGAEEEKEEVEAEEEEEEDAEEVYEELVAPAAAAARKEEQQDEVYDTAIAGIPVGIKQKEAKAREEQMEEHDSLVNATAAGATIGLEKREEEARERQNSVEENYDGSVNDEASTMSVTASSVAGSTQPLNYTRGDSSAGKKKGKCCGGCCIS
jgi:hypothetical protein